MTVREYIETLPLADRILAVILAIKRGVSPDMPMDELMKRDG